MIDERDHYHCPAGCEHPQPWCAGMLLLCGLCYYFHARVTVMVPCNKEFCGERPCAAGDLRREAHIRSVNVA